MPFENECELAGTGVWFGGENGVFVPWDSIATATIIDDESVPGAAIMCSFNDGYGKEYSFEFKVYPWLMARMGRELMGWKARGPVRKKVLLKLRGCKR